MMSDSKWHIVGAIVIAMCVFIVIWLSICNSDSRHYVVNIDEQVDIEAEYKAQVE